MFSQLTRKAPQLTERLFCKSGYNGFGHIKREPDTRTQDQLLENIDYYVQKYPQVAQFRNDLKSMNPKHLGLVSDIFELADCRILLDNDVNMITPGASGKSLLQYLMEKLPKAEKENPASLEFFQEIINNASTGYAKKAIDLLASLCEAKALAPYIKATTPLVDEVAEATLPGSYLIGNERAHNFVNALMNYMAPNVSLEKLQILPKIIKIADKSKPMCIIESFPFLTNSTPINTITRNLETFSKLEPHMGDITFNLTEFLEKNVNLQ